MVDFGEKYKNIISYIIQQALNSENKRMNRLSIRNIKPNNYERSINDYDDHDGERPHSALMIYSLSLNINKHSVARSSSVDSIIRDSNNTESRQHNESRGESMNRTESH